MPAADEKVYSLFEEHTELLKRGKAGKPIEFGHKVLIAQTGEKSIYHYQVYPERQENKGLLEPTLKAHKQLFGNRIVRSEASYSVWPPAAALERAN